MGVLRRYYLREGAKTTVDGVVRATSYFSTLDGKAQILDGDPVDCPACGTQGVVQCVMPRLPDSLHDGQSEREYALGGDLCICKCVPSPKLIADQDRAWQELVVVDEEVQAPLSVSVASEPPTPIRFVDNDTGKPHANRPYRLELKDGKVLAGTLDADGCTRPLTKDERDAVISRSVAVTAPTTE